MMFDMSFQVLACFSHALKQHHCVTQAEPLWLPAIAAPGQQHSYLQKLVRGMPKRLARCKKNKYGRCGK